MNFKITLLNVVGFFISLYGIVGLGAWLYNRYVNSDTSTDITMQYVPYFLIIGLICFLFDYMLQKVFKLSNLVMNLIGLAIIICIYFLSSSLLF